MLVLLPLLLPSESHHPHFLLCQSCSLSILAIMPIIVRTKDLNLKDVRNDWDENRMELAKAPDPRKYDSLYRRQLDLGTESPIADHELRAEIWATASVRLLLKNTSSRTPADGGTSLRMSPRLGGGSAASLEPRSTLGKIA